MGLKGWITGLAYGGKIKETVGTILGMSRGGIKSKNELRVRVIHHRRAGKYCILLEVVCKSLGSYYSTAVTIGAEQIEECIGVLRLAKDTALSQRPQ